LLSMTSGHKNLAPTPNREREIKSQSPVGHNWRISSIQMNC